MRPKKLGSSSVILNCSGDVAQWLEQSAHNRLVPGSSPGIPTILVKILPMPFGGKINLDKERVKRITDVRNLVLYLFMLVVLAITWSGVKAVQSNFELQKRISQLRQENEVLALENDNAKLDNKYLETQQYLELTARQNLGLAAPGEKVMLVPKSVALEKTDPEILKKYQNSENDRPEYKRPGYIKNLEQWRDFLTGRKLFEESPR